MDGKWALLYFIVAAAITILCIDDDNIDAMKQAISTMVVAQVNGAPR